RLAGASGGELVPDRPRPAHPTYRGGGERQVLGADLSAALRGLARREGATLFMVLAAALDQLLQRHTGDDDLLLGYPIAGRSRPEVEPLIGLFLNTLVLRVDLSGGLDFRGLLARVREESLAGFVHQSVPFEKLLEEIRPDRDLSRTPFFQVFLNVLNFPVEEIRIPGIALEADETSSLLAKFDLTLYVDDAGPEIRINWIYNADLFDPDRMSALARQLGSVLEQAAGDPALDLDRFSLVTPEALAVLPDPAVPLAEVWNGPVHHRFAEAARRFPDRPALIDPRGTWTYRQLAARSARLAGELRAAGVGPGDRVAVYAGRCAELPCALLGILQAGAAFLVLDAAYPEPRLLDLLESAAPRAWIALAPAGPPPPGIAAWIESAVSCRLRLEDAAGEDGHADGGLAPGAEVAPGQPAYVAFTSGSTGRPKGILGSHGPLAHFLDWYTGAFEVGPEDRFSMLSGLGHDPLLRDIFVPLSVGATLCIPETGATREPRELLRWMAGQAISVAHLTPALGRLLADAAELEPLEPGTAALGALRRAFFAGDRLRWRDVDRLRGVAPGAICVNFYGATETPQAMGSFTVPADGRRRAGEFVPLGWGIDGVQLLVLGRARGLAGLWERGEIHIRTPYLALGYLDEDAAERFVANPFTGDPADRVYRTGDLGRTRPDGSLEFLGRSDRQVSVRGFRVEPAEIEAALARHPGLREALVGRIDGRLVAYLVARGEDKPTAAELRRFLGGLLPDYMIPAAFVFLQAVPLTPNGKVDWRALPAPEERQERLQALPVSPVEELLATIWSEVFRRGQVSVLDDFFDLGGHSLLAAQVAARVGEAFGIDLPVRSLFEHPTIAGLASVIQEARSASRVQAPPIVPLPRDRDFPLSFAQERLWFLDRLGPGRPVYNMPLAVRLRGALDVGVLEQALGEVVRRQEALRTTFAVVEGRPVQRIAPAQRVRLPVVSLSGLMDPEPEVRRIVLEEARRPFDLGRGPLFNVRLLRLREAESVLLCNVHHILSDGWSVGLLVEELTALYGAFSQGEPSPLSDLPVQYADFAVWQRGWLQGEVLESEISFWKERLAGAPPSLELPTDRPRPAIQTLRGARLLFQFPRATAQSLQSLARGERATVFMVLLGGLAALLARTSHQEDLVVGTPAAGRSRRELERVVGLFVNTLALRIGLEGMPSFRSLLRQAREVVLASHLHQDLPFEKLVEELRVARNLSQAPLFQVMLAAQNVPMPAQGPAGLELTFLEAGTGTSKFDVTFLVSETEEGLAGAVEYSTDLFDATTVRRMVEHWQVLLEAAVADPDRRVSSLPLLTAGERAQLLEWNATERTLPGPELLHEIFAAQAARAPEAEAVVFEGRSLTYAELDAAANRWARHLRRKGVGPEVLVGVCMERSIEQIVALLAILKA
ncbi:MAG: amino acid adenylation domain-containing protein, partial [Thermoanaerobaculia bacterium]